MDTWDAIGAVDADHAGQMGFFLFPSGGGSVPRRVAESCVRLQVGVLLVVACVLGWNDLMITGFGYKLVPVSSGLDTVNCLAGAVKIWLITYGDLV
jgi:hypothetical protein